MLEEKLLTYEHLNCLNFCRFHLLVNFLHLCRNQNRSKMIYHLFLVKRYLQNCLFFFARIHKGTDRVGHNRLHQKNKDVLCLLKQGYGFLHMKLLQPFYYTVKLLLLEMVDKVLSRYFLEDLSCHLIPIIHRLLRPKQR